MSTTCDLHDPKELEKIIFNYFIIWFLLFLKSASSSRTKILNQTKGFRERGTLTSESNALCTANQIRAILNSIFSVN